MAAGDPPDDEGRIVAMETLVACLPDEPLQAIYAALERAKWDVDVAANALISRPKATGKRSIADFFSSQGSQNEPAAKQRAQKPFFSRDPAPLASTEAVEVPNDRNALLQLSWKPGVDKKKPRNTYYNLILDTPELLATHVPSCSLFPNFLPEELADSILAFMCKESTTWEVPSYVIFEREVHSSHTSATYVTNYDELLPSSSSPHELRTSQAGLVFGGRYLSDVRRCTPELVQAKMLIEAKVNELMNQRERHRLEVQGPWTINTVLANSYPDEQSGVGPHTDRMTHIGPRPTIASLTLGACRVFRLRPMDNEDNPDPTLKPDASSFPSYLIPLPHNSLLIMGPPCQETYKHDVPKITSNLPSLKRNPISGTERINLTFRHYREDYEAAKIPSCNCGNKMDLQCAFKKDREKYFFTCAGAGGKGRRVGERCGFFKWLE